MVDLTKLVAESVEDIPDTPVNTTTRGLLHKISTLMWIMQVKDEISEKDADLLGEFAAMLILAYSPEENNLTKLVKQIEERTTN